VNKETRLESAIRKYEKDVDFVLDDVLLKLNESIVAAMQAQGISRSELAAKMGTSKAYITRLLRGNANPTVRSLVRIGIILGALPTVTVEAESNWAPSAESAATKHGAERQAMQRPGLIPFRVPVAGQQVRMKPCESVRFNPATWSPVGSERREYA
jgi:transcriptional regulator with XRE-family HTH domain